MTIPTIIHMHDGHWVASDKKILIPDEANILQLLLCIIAHTCAARRQGGDATETAHILSFHCKTLTEDVELFILGFIQCLYTTGGERIPPSFGPSLLVTAPKNLLQLGYIELRTSNSGDTDVLMIRDDHIGYAWLYPCTSPN